MTEKGGGVGKQACDLSIIICASVPGSAVPSFFLIRRPSSPCELDTFAVHEFCPLASVTNPLPVRGFCQRLFL